MQQASTIADKIVETLYSNRVTSENERIHTPALHSKLGCLLFSKGSSNSGTTLDEGDGGGGGGGKSFFFPFWSQKNVKKPL